MDSALPKYSPSLTHHTTLSLAYTYCPARILCLYQTDRYLSGIPSALQTDRYLSGIPSALFDQLSPVQYTHIYFYILAPNLFRLLHLSNFFFFSAIRAQPSSRIQ